MIIPPRYLFSLGEFQLRKIVQLTTTDVLLLTKTGSKGSLINWVKASNRGACSVTRIELYIKGIDQSLRLHGTVLIASSTGASLIYSIPVSYRFPPGVELWAKSTVAIPSGIRVEVDGSHIGNIPV